MPASPTARAVFLAYGQFWAMFLRLLHNPDPTDPQIAALTAEPLTGQLRAQQRQDLSQGKHVSGTIHLKPIISSVDRDAAQVGDCIDQRGLVTTVDG